MRKTIVVLAMLALVVPALADLAPETVKGQIGGQAFNQRGVTVYDNTVNGPTGAFSQNPGAWIGDELIMTGGGILDDVAFSIYNSSTSAGNLDFVDADIYFFDSVLGTYIGGVTFNDIDLFDPVFGATLLPGYFTTFYANGLSGLGINLPSTVLAVEVLYNPLGGATKMGQIMMNPPVLGSSTDDFYLDNTVATPAGTNVGWYWFSGNPIANFYWGVSVVPEPASVGLLALGALALIRRR